MVRKLSIPVFLMGCIIGCANRTVPTPTTALPPGFERWVTGNQVLLTASDATGTVSTTWKYDLLGPGDARVVREIRTPKATSTGNVYLYGGQLLVTRGIELRPGFEVDAIDYPAIMVNLLFELLARGAPEGPGGVTGERTIDVVGKTKPIIVATDSAYSTYRAPWSIRGALKRLDRERIGFQLTFAYADEKRAGDFSYHRLHGEWAESGDLQPLDRAMRLVGHDVFLLGSGSRTPGGSRIPAERLTNVSTVDEVLKLVSARDAIDNARARHE